MEINKRRRFWNCVFATAVIWGTLVAALGLENSGDINRAEDIFSATFHLLLVSPFLLLVLFAVMWAAATMVNRFRGRPLGWQLSAAIIGFAAAMMILPAAWHHRPAHRLADLLLDPVPASISNIHVGRATTFGEGGAWFFSFDCTAADFQRIRQQGQLTERQVDWQRYNNAISEGEYRAECWKWSAFPEERLFGNWDGYSRPTPPFHVFLAERRVFVTDAKMTHVQVGIDEYRPPSTAESSR